VRSLLQFLRHIYFEDILAEKSGEWTKLNYAQIYLLQSQTTANKENAQNLILKIAMAIPVSQIPALLFIYYILTFRNEKLMHNSG